LTVLPVVRVLLGHVHRGWDQLLNDPQARPGFVRGDLSRHRPMLQRPDEEASCCLGVPALGEEHVDDLPELICSTPRSAISSSTFR
jgi:hypothetical protein